MGILSEGKKRFKQSEIGLIPEDWELKTLKEICLQEKGSVISGPFGSNIGSRFFVEKGIPVIRGNNLTTDFTKFVDNGFVFITEEKANELHTWAEHDDLVFTAAGTLGQVAIVPFKRKYEKYIISNKQLRARLDKKKVIPLFAFYWFQSKKMVAFVNVRNTGSTIPLINLAVLKSLPLPFPLIEEQKAIVEILYAIDSKIELNQQMNGVLEAVGQAVFKRWFIDFEFPNEEGKPYKSSGGEMIYDKILSKEIPASWTTRALNEISTNFDSKRVPLSSREREKIKGVYPYYGAVGVVDYINQFLFDGTYLLMSEDGVYVINENGFPTLQLVRGRFWVNNHAHVLQGNGISTELLFLLVKNTNVQSIVTGAVQPKINQGNMNTLKFTIPDEKCKRVIENFANKIFTKIIRNSEQNQTLSQVRDNLLPKLMSGKIRVPMESNMESQ